MRIPWKWSVPIACAALVACASAPSDVGPRGFNDPKNTVFTVEDPIRIGAADLKPGTYVIHVVSHETDLNLLKVTDVGMGHVYTTFQARQRMHPTVENGGEGNLAFVEQAGAPHLLRFWEVPNHSFGYDISTVPWTPASAATLTLSGPSLRTASR